MGREGEEKRPSFRMSRSFNLRRMFEGPAKHGHNLSFAGEAAWNDNNNNEDQYKLQSRSFVPRSPRTGVMDLHNVDDSGKNSKNYSNVPKSPQPPSGNVNNNDLDIVPKSLPC